MGGRLLPVLVEEGDRPLRSLARRPEHLRPRVAPGTAVVEGDVLAPSTLDRALAGIETAYYLVHSMGATDDFEERDRRAAENFAAAGRRVGVSRIVYLGAWARATTSPPTSAAARR